MTMNSLGGVGAVATTVASRKAESVVRQAVPFVLAALKAKGYNVSHKSGFKVGVRTMRPDGGIWYLGNTPVLAVEAKYQGPRGNAIERWAMNYLDFKTANPKASYLTFASGEGAAKKTGPIWRTLYAVHNGEYNKLRPARATGYLRSEGFSLEEVIEIVIALYEQTVKNFT